MASSFTSVPVVDVSPLLKDLNAGRKSLSVDALQVCSDLHRACQDVGFFYVSNHGVSKQLQDELAAAAKVFFSLDEVTKARFSMAKGGRAWRGWFQLGDELTSGRADQKEGYYFGTVKKMLLLQKFVALCKSFFW
jgi:isopenicillin N synthase-like dioxygenase